MIEIMIMVALVAFIVWQIDQLPPLTKFAIAGGYNPNYPDDPDFEPDARPAWEDHLMFKKSGGEPAADPRIGQAALENAELGREWLGFAKEQFDVQNERQAPIDDLANQVTQVGLDASRQGAEWAARDRARYEDKFLPIEDQFIDQASNWDTAARREGEAGKAMADVYKAADIQKEVRARDMARMGIDPRSGRHAGVERSADTQTALNAAGAANMARQSVEAQGLAMKGDITNMGRGLPSQAMSGAGLGLNAANSAMNTQLAAAGNARANTGIMAQGFQGAMSGNSSMANTLMQQRSQDIGIWNSQNQNRASGIGQIMEGAGTLGTLALLAPSSKDIKENKKPADEALPQLNGLNVEEWDYKDGVADGGRHVGPYAEDFKRETGMGDGKSIDVVSAIGLNIKAVQELDEKIESVAKQVGKGKKSKKKETANGLRGAA